MIEQSKKNFLSTNCYEDKEVHAYFDEDKYKIYSEAQQIAASQLRQLTLTSKGETTLSGTVIDVGCGTGNMLLMLKKTFDFAHIYGMDLSSEMLSIAKDKVLGLIAICDSATSLREHFSEPTADLLLIHFLFAYVEYRKLLDSTLSVVKKGGLLSICTTTGNAFQGAKEAALTKIGKIVGHFCSVNLSAVINEYLEWMPKNANTLIDEMNGKGYEVLDHKVLTIKISLANWREAWDFLHNAGWFVGAMQQYKLTKFKVFLMFNIGKILGLFPMNNGRVEDEIEIVVLTARNV